MPDVLRTFLKYTAHEDLRKAYDAWDASSRVRDREEFKTTTRLMELLARETRIWAFSKLVNEGRLPRDLDIPPVKTDFGREVNFIDAIHDQPLLQKLTASCPDATDAFVKLEDVFDVVQDYLKASDDTADECKTRLQHLQTGPTETWLQTLRVFQRLRNLAAHDAAQPNAQGVATDVSDRLGRLVPSIVRSMRVRIDWMVRQAATHIGQYELRSKDLMRKDRDYSVRILLNNNAFSVDSADYWYVLYVDDDDARSAVDLFPRLESRTQIEGALAGAVESVDSPIFDSARKGCFLPVIGPAFGSPDQIDSPGASEIIERARSVVGDERFKNERELLAGFLRRLISDRLSLDVPDLLSAACGPCDTPRAALVGELASLALDATRAFGRSLSTAGTAFSVNGECLGDADVERLRQRIRDVRDFVRSLHNDRTLVDGDRIDIGVDAMDEGLRILAADEISDKRLSVGSLAWLGDLVWHALRWDTSVYPDSQALNLQLSLGMGGSTLRGGPAFGRTLASSGTALSIDSTDLEEYVRDWCQRNERRTRHFARGSRGRDGQDPYYVIAQALALCLRNRQQLTPGDAAADAETTDDYGRIEARNAVFVVDATFDQRMCTALQAIGAKYAVVYPIDVEDKVNIRHPAWAMRRCPRPSNPELEYEVLWDGCGRTIDWQDVPRVVVIKPYGAPLEPTEPLEKAVLRVRTDATFPITADRQGEFFGISRRFLFDDVSILKDMVQKQDSMPPGFRDAIHDRTRRFEVFFLGYSIDEHGRRARIVADMRPAGDDGQDTRDKPPLYLSQPSPNPSGFIYTYLERAGFKNQKRPLGSAMRDLALSLKQHKADGARP